MANFLANVGLMSEGYGAAEKERQQMNANDQTATVRQQQIDVGQMGLEEAIRVRDTEKAMRQAGGKAIADERARQAAYAANPGDTSNLPRGQAGTYEDMALAVEATDPQRAMQIRAEKEKAIAGGVPKVIDRVMKDSTEGARPDLAEVFNQQGDTFWEPSKTFLKKDPQTGDMMLTAVNAKTGVERTFAVGATAEKLGLVNNKTVNLGPGHSLVRESTGKTIASNAATDKYKITDGVMFNSTTGEYQSVEGSGGNKNVSKMLPVLNSVRESILESDGMGTMDVATGKRVPTPEGQKRTVVGEQLAVANPSIAPATIRDIAVNGKPVIGSDGSKGMQYQGQIFKLNRPSGIAAGITPTAPTAPQTPAVATPTPASPTQAAPAPAQSKPTFSSQDARALVQARQAVTAAAGNPRAAASARNNLAQLEAKKSAAGYSKGGKITLGLE